MRTLFVVVVLVVCACPVLATNRGFLPGDACFHSIITRDRIAELSGSGTATIPFVRPKGEQFGFCGYAGYWSLQLPPGSEPLIKNLSELYTELRLYSRRELVEYVNLDGETIQSETNGFHIFVYNHDFDPLRYNIALRYNENWSEDESSFGPRASITRLESYVADRVAFSNDWRDAKSVPALRAICPAIPDQEKRMKRGMGSKRIDDPVVANDRVQIILTVDADFRRYIHQRKGATFYSITNSGVSSLLKNGFAVRRSVFRRGQGVEPQANHMIFRGATTQNSAKQTSRNRNRVLQRAVKEYRVRKGEWVVTDWTPVREDE